MTIAALLEIAETLEEAHLEMSRLDLDDPFSFAAAEAETKFINAELEFEKVARNAIPEIKAMAEENARMREALEFYADETKYFGTVISGEHGGTVMEWPAYQDNGNRARAAIGAKP